MLLSIASASSYFLSVGQGIAVGDMLELPGREADIVVAQHRSTYWLMASLFCFTGSIVATTFALPFYSDASRLPRYIARFVLATIFSVLLTLFIGVVAMEINRYYILHLHRSVVH